jgi:protocatechuate 3,4-dioxygenase beta subunit
MNSSKRKFLTSAALLGAAGGAGLIGPSTALAGAQLARTPIMDLGPFYPIEKPMEDDADLTRLAGHKDRAKGAVLDLAGRVLNRDGVPVAGARIELWQANAAGRYDHHDDRHDAPLDPDFQGYARQTADSDGRFRFLTVKPGAYPSGDYLRSPHIHFDVSGKYDRLITQMYFPGDPLLKQDRRLAQDLLGYKGVMPDQIFGRLRPGASTADPGATLCLFDIVLGDG